MTAAPTRWLVDEMLARLARLMRAAGHDVALAAPGEADRTLIARARLDGRVLVTRDRELAREAGDLAARIDADDIETQARELKRLKAIDWLLAPFTRCVLDNTPLRAAAPVEVAALPGDTSRLPGPFTVCPTCGRRYWPGSHAKRLRLRLEALAEGL